MPSVALLLAAAEVDQPGAIAFVYPRSTNVALAAATVAALSRVSVDFPQALQEFRERGLQPGQRVAVMPTGHVYQYDGPFADPKHRFDRPHIRLKILEPSVRVSPRDRVSEPTIRVFPADEIARLKPTTRSVPAGKQNTPLQDWRPSPLDDLTGIRSGGNSALFRNRVLLLSTRADLDHFFASVTVARAGHGVLVRDVLTSASIAEEGVLQPDDRFQSGEQPLVAVTHLVERLAEVCEHATPCSKTVLVNGASALARNHQAYDGIAARQRLILIADHGDEECLVELAARGCRVWRLTESEILLGTTTVSRPDVTAEKPDVPEAISGLFAEAKRSATIADHLQIASIAVEEQAVSEAAAKLAQASDLVRQEADDSIRKPVSLAFGALLELASWLGPPAPADLSTYLRRLDAISADAQRLGPWAPAGLRTALTDAVASMKRTATDSLVGWSKLEALVVAIDSMRAAGSSVGIVTRNTHAAALTRAQLPEYLRSLPVFAASLVPSDLRLDTLFVASWLKRDTMSRLINLYLARDIRLLAFPFEHAWLSSLVRSRRAASRYGNVDTAAKASILGLPEAPKSVEEPTVLHSSLEPDFLAVDRLTSAEAWLNRRRKGGPADLTDEHDQRLARYVGFVGDTYAYVTVGRALPVVTDLVRGLGSDQARVPLTTIDQLRAGEYVLFRDQGERDVISLFAEHEMGSARYKERRSVADRWKHALRSLGKSHFEVSQRLREIGVSKHAATIRSWSLDADKIGPGSRTDIEAIARAVGQSDAWADEVWNAILDIRGAHIAAGQRLSQFLLSELPKSLKSVGEAETLVDLTLVQAWVVEIDEIGDVESRSYTEVNRLLWG